MNSERRKVSLICKLPMRERQGLFKEWAIQTVFKWFSLWFQTSGWSEGVWPALITLAVVSVDVNLGELQVDMKSSFCFYNPWGLDLKTSHGSDLRMLCSFSEWFGGPVEMCNYLNLKKKKALYLHICQNDWIALQIDLIFKFLLTVIHYQMPLMSRNISISTE